MPIQKRHKTKYAGVYFIEGKRIGTNKPEKIYYVTYRKNGRLISEKAGRQYADDMTPARAAGLRTERIEGKQPTNKERRQAEKAAATALSEKWTLDRLWEEYKLSRKQNKALSTDSGRYRNYLKNSFGKKQPIEIQPLEIERLKRNLLKKKSPQTVKHILNLLSWIVNYGVKNGLCNGLTFHLKKPTVHNEKTEDLTPQQLSDLIRVIDEDDHPQAGAMMKLALFSGLRRSEMFKLKWKDVNFNEGFMTIVDPKGGKDEKVPLSDSARELLENHPKPNKSEFVFPGRHGKQRTDINKALRKIKAKANLPKDFRPLHGLRHVYASMLASSGEVDLYTLQKIIDSQRSPHDATVCTPKG